MLCITMTSEEPDAEEPGATDAPWHPPSAAGGKHHGETSSNYEETIKRELHIPPPLKFVCARSHAVAVTAGDRLYR